MYSEPNVCALTIVTADRSAIFRSDEWATLSIQVLKEAATKHSISVLAYCFMPDRVHLLVLNQGRSSIIGFVKDFKQFTGYRYKQRTGFAMWQKSYHDHLLRSEEGVLAAARYVFGNPVRAGLVARPEDYPFSGSLEWGAQALAAS